MAFHPTFNTEAGLLIEGALLILCIAIFWWWIASVSRKVKAHEAELKSTRAAKSQPKQAKQQEESESQEEE